MPQTRQSIMKVPNERIVQPIQPINPARQTADESDSQKSQTGEKLPTPMPPQKQAGKKGKTPSEKTKRPTQTGGDHIDVDA